MLVPQRKSFFIAVLYMCVFCTIYTSLKFWKKKSEKSINPIIISYSYMCRLFMQSWSIVYRSLYLGRWKATVHLCSLCRQLYTLRGCRETVWPADSSIHSYKSCLCNTAAHKERSTQPSKHLLQEPAATSLSCGLRRSTTTNKKHITPLSYCQTQACQGWRLW